MFGVDQAGEGLTALRFDDSGLQCAVGTTNGLVALFDLRASRPSIVKDHMYGAPIIDIKFHASDSMAGAQCLLSQCLCCSWKCLKLLQLSWYRSYVVKHVE